MQGTTLIIISAIALARGASIDIEVNRNGCPVDFTVEKLSPHENCNQFYQCFNGIPIAQTCPANLYYNIDSHVCDWPYNVKCDDRITPENINGNDNEGHGNDEINHEGNGYSDPSEAPAICAAEGSDGVLVAHEDCTKFYKCWQGHPVAISCPSNLLYNPTKEQCDWHFNVQCNDRTIPGQLNKNGNPSEAPAICAAEGSDGILIASENCNQFYKCSEGHPVRINCPLNLLYNYNKEQCDWPENVDCGNRVIPDENDDESNDNDGNDDNSDVDGENDSNNVNGDPSEAPAICAEEGSNGILIAHEKCNQFYKCYSGHPVALKCPLNLLYNYEKEQCDWPQNVDCRNRVIPDESDEEGNENDGSDNDGAENDGSDNEDGGSDSDDNGDENGGNSDPNEAAAICAAENSDTVLVAHENCNQFYQCWNGKPVAAKCPANLLFNPALNICDWPQNVNCEDRIKPNSNIVQFIN